MQECGHLLVRDLLHRASRCIFAPARINGCPMNIRVDVSLDLEAKLDARTLTVGVIGMGYVGLPLTHAFWQAGLKVVGFDIDPLKVEKLSAGGSYINTFT